MQAVALVLAALLTASYYSLSTHHCLRRVHSRARETLEVVLADRLHLGWRRPDAAELRAHAKTGGSVAEK